jgi:hypothetical protein
LYLGLAFVIMIVGVGVVAFMHRQPAGMDASIEEFEKNRQALAPEPDAPRRRPRAGRE